MLVAHCLSTPEIPYDAMGIDEEKSLVKAGNYVTATATFIVTLQSGTGYSEITTVDNLSTGEFFKFTFPRQASTVAEEFA